MKQQVNLYQPIFRKREIIFSARAMIQITGFFIVVLAAVYFYHLMKLEPFRDELVKTDAEFEKLTSQIEEIARQLPSPSGSRLLENEIARLTRDLEMKNRLREALATGSFGNVEGFSGFLEGLANSHVQGAWLTGIVIGRGGKLLSINGESINPELVPVYIQRLADEPAFDNRNFNVVELKRSTTAPQQITFFVGTGS